MVCDSARFATIPRDMMNSCLEIQEDGLEEAPDAPHTRKLWITRWGVCYELRLLRFPTPMVGDTKASHDTVAFTRWVRGRIGSRPSAHSRGWNPTCAHSERGPSPVVREINGSQFDLLRTVFASAVARDRSLPEPSGKRILEPSLKEAEQDTDTNSNRQLPIR